jgi:hypothetical protein
MIRLDDRVYKYDYFNIEIGRHRNYRDDYDSDWEDGEWWSVNEDLTMTMNGLKSDKKLEEEANDGKDDNEEKSLPPAPASPALPKPGTKDSITIKKDSVYHYNGQVLPKPAANTEATADEADQARVSNSSNSGSRTPAIRANTYKSVSPMASVFRM